MPPDEIRTYLNTFLLHSIAVDADLPTRRSRGRRSSDCMKILEVDHGLADADAQRSKVAARPSGSSVTGQRRRRGIRGGLALGFVQSGKTMSFTTLAAPRRRHGVPADHHHPRQHAPARRPEHGPTVPATFASRSATTFTGLPSSRGEGDRRHRLHLNQEGRAVLVDSPEERSAPQTRSLSMLERSPRRATPALVIDDEADQASERKLRSRRARSLRPTRRSEERVRPLPATSTSSTRRRPLPRCCSSRTTHLSPEFLGC